MLLAENADPLVDLTAASVIDRSGASGMSAVTLPRELIDAINQVGFWDSIPLRAVTRIGACIIFSAVSSCLPAVDTSVSVETAVWTHVGQSGLQPAGWRGQGM